MVLAAPVVMIFMTMFSCTTTSSGSTEEARIHTEQGSENGTPADSRDIPPGDQSQAVAEMETYLGNAFSKLDEMAVAEAIHQFVAVVAVRDKISSPSSKILELAKRAETELTRIEAGFLLQPGSEWLDANENQTTAGSMSAGKPGGLQPKVLLWYNVGGSRIALSGVPVVFEFVKGTGLLSGYTTTNEYGEASVPLGRIDNPNKETVIRATVSYTVKGYTYRFKQTSLEFVYLPPSKRATILVLERGPDYIAEDPQIFNPVYTRLKDMEFDFIPYNGRLIQDGFMKVFGGDLASIKKLALEQNVPYLIMVLNDCYRASQVEGRRLYVGEGTATLRIIRVADGKILFEAIGYADRDHDTYGQGNSTQTAMRNVFVNGAEQLQAELARKKKEINRALGIE